MPERAMTLMFLILISFLPVIFMGCGHETAVDDVSLAEVGPFSAVIQWQSASPAAHTVFFGEGALLDRKAEETEQTLSHSVTLTGLKPSTLFSYRVGETGKTYTFRTAPGTEGSFDLAILDEKSDACRPGAAPIDTLPDLIVLYGSCPGLPKESRASTLTVLPTGSQPVKKQVGSALLDIFSQTPAVLPAPDRKKARHHITIVPELPDGAVPGLETSLILSPRAAKAGDVAVQWESTQNALLEIDTYEIAWVTGGVKNRTRKVIIEAPPETKKTCLYCDRLMESGRYEESLAWYREFIERESKMHQLEDAYFAIARILDEKLFRYAKALDAYQEFLDYFPQSRKKVLARYRVDYILSHGDNDYKPLAEFEEAKARLVRDDPLPVVEKVEAMVGTYPESPVSAEALYWMGNLLQESHPDRARDYFRTLIERFPRQENALVAAIALGDILYREKLYRQSRVAYEKALAIAPDNFKVSISEKLRKSIRNIRREQLRWGCWILLAGWVAISLVLKASPSKKDLIAFVLTLAAYGFTAGIYFALAYERAIPYLTPVALLGLFTALILMWNRALARRISRFHVLLVMFHAGTCSAAAVYLTLYRFHQVYLIGF